MRHTTALALAALAAAACGDATIQIGADAGWPGPDADGSYDVEHPTSAEDGPIGWAPFVPATDAGADWDDDSGVPASGDGDGDGLASGDGDDPEPCADRDGDGTCDWADICQAYDDRIDSDGDGVPDGCDQCPGLDDADADLNGLCE